MKIIKPGRKINLFKLVTHGKVFDHKKMEKIEILEEMIENMPPIENEWAEGYQTGLKHAILVLQNKIGGE